MPARNSIAAEITKRQQRATDDVRRRFLKQLSNFTGNDTILYSTAFTSGSKQIPAYALSVSMPDLQGFMAWQELGLT